MSKFFAFLYVEDEETGNLLNTAIAVLNPRAKWPAHVTVSGPFSSRRQLPRKLSYYRTMDVCGVGQFRSDEQNTVYLRVGTFDLRHISRKPDFGYNPHLTLYDGDDHVLGDRLFYRLKTCIPYMRLHVSRLHLVETGSAQREMHFLFDKLDDALVRQYDLTWSNIEGLGVSDRIELATNVINRAVHASKGPSSTVTSAIGKRGYRK